MMVALLLVSKGQTPTEIGKMFMNGNLFVPQGLFCYIELRFNDKLKLVATTKFPTRGNQQGTGTLLRKKVM